MSARKTIMVTGGSGFIGSAVCRHAVGNLGHRVVNVDKMTYAATEESTQEIAASPLYTFHRADIRDRAAMLGIMQRENVDLVMNLAAESHVDRSIDAPDDFIDTNVLGTLSLLNAARAYRDGLSAARADAFRFHQISTDEVFGSLPLDSGCFTETSPYDPSSPYSASKAAADHLVRAWGRTFGLAILISNSSNNYGPFQFPEKLIPLMIVNSLLGLELPVYGNGLNVRDWLYVEDHAAALVEVALNGRPGESYNVGGNAERNNLEVVQSIADAVDRLVPGAKPRRALIKFVQDRPGHDLRYATSTRKIGEELNWAPRHSFDEGLKKTIQWFVANDAWWQRLRTLRYAGQRLGAQAAT